MYICRNKLVYYHIVKDFERIYFSLLKYKNNYTKWRGKLIHIRMKIAKTCRQVVEIYRFSIDFHDLSIYFRGFCRINVFLYNQ